MADEQSFPSPIDLHTHSSVSDGTQTPAELVEAAQEAGLGTVALTDHDSTGGWAEAAGAAARAGIRLIPGMELSTRYDGWKSVHMLAYLFDPDDAAITAETARIRRARLTRAEAIVQKLSVDYGLTWDDVLAHTTPGASIGRPHIADALVSNGIVDSRSAAFETLLHPAGGYYQQLYAPTPLEGVALIAGAGGVAVLAHPVTYGRKNALPESYFAQLIDAGLAGLEIDHRENTEDGKAYLRELARRNDLIVTGSSDYHGAGKPNRLGENTTSVESLERIVAAATGSRPI
jgi:predicted metal-dependent phosphoesterase TrpH